MFGFDFFKYCFRTISETIFKNKARKYFIFEIILYHCKWNENAYFLQNFASCISTNYFFIIPPGLKLKVHHIQHYIYVLSPNMQIINYAMWCDKVRNGQAYINFNKLSSSLLIQQHNINTITTWHFARKWHKNRVNNW